MKHTELNELIAELQAMVDESDPQKGYWSQLWTLSKQIGQSFKETRYPTLAEKNDSWGEFQRVREKAAERSAEQKERMAQNEVKWAERKQDSDRALSKISWHASRARPMNDLERSIAEMIFLPITIMDRILSDLLGIESKDDLQKIKEELEWCNEQLSKAWTVFNENKEVMTGSDKAEAYKTLNEARTKLDLAWTEWKNANQRLFLAQQRAWEERKHEREAKRQDFIARVETNIDKLEEKLEKAKAALSKQESTLDDLKEKLESAWSENFRDRCSSWIEECETRIQDINSHIERMEGWLQEERSKLK